MDGIVIEGEYYIRLAGLSAQQNVIHQRVSMKHGDSFALLDRRGDLPHAPSIETGFYVGGTRHLSALELRLGEEKPMLLSSSLSDDDVQLVSILTNGDAMDATGASLPKDAVLLSREITVHESAFVQRIELRSYHTQRVTLQLVVRAGADFRDIFEVRGYTRKARGEVLPPLAEGDRVTFTYTGLDEVIRRTVVRFEPGPATVTIEDGLDGTRIAIAHWRLALDPHEAAVLEISATGGLASGLITTVPDTRKAIEKVRREQTRWDRTATGFFTSHDGLNELLERASADLRLMCTRMPEGLVPYAGIPWYACPFGRDSLWTSLMTLPLQPRVSAGTLRYLAARQAERFDDFLDAEPGKILHEMRTGEMANLREIPFVPYYGTVDATPLFVVLLDRYVRWTGDRDLLEQLWPAAMAALSWVQGPGDLDGDGFVEYSRRSPVGLMNHGWKDSNDSIFHAGGALAEGRIALVEAQAYAFASLRSGMRLARMRGEESLADSFERAAARLQKRFEAEFWSEELGTYAIALDGAKRPCEIVSSNAGHALWAGIASEEHAARVAESLLSPAMFSGWGVRTLAEGQARYNPISYHDGSVWPHDNAIIAAGLKRYGYRAEASRIATAVLDAAQMFDDLRVPELFCGFKRESRHAPTPYPVACRPQAWSAATVFSLLETLLGLEVDGVEEKILLTRPSLPQWIDWIEITGLPAGSKVGNVRLERTARGGALATRTSGTAKVVIRK